MLRMVGAVAGALRIAMCSSKIPESCQFTPLSHHGSTSKQQCLKHLRLQTLIHSTLQQAAAGVDNSHQAPAIANTYTLYFAESCRWC